MMDIYIFFQILLVSIAATSAMTLFSYAISASFRELYKEPVLLAFVFQKIRLQITASSKTVLGWLTHYIIGFLFVLSYHFVWIKDILKIVFMDTLLLGIISGIIGIVSWMFIFKATHYQPRIDFKGYYIQLFFAHIIFALTATATYHISSIVSILVNAYVTH